MRAFTLYYQQSADKLNLVNTVMLESTKSAYQQAVGDVVNSIQLADRIQNTQTALDIAAGETITGVSSWNQAVKHATDRLKEGGIVGFIDHGNHRWSAEAYVAMDVRTTVYNTGRAAVWETNENFGNDLYLVSYHNGARPLCYDWQNKVISSANLARDTVDLDGNTIHVYAQSETTYGEPAGLFGINCKHYPSPFIPGVSIIRGEPQSPEENAKTYAESQHQRQLERKLREEKRDVLMAKAQGAPQEEIDKLQEKARQTSADIDTFCEETGRARHRDREGVYTQRSFPSKDTYDVSEFERTQKEKIEQFYKTGGAQKSYQTGVLQPKVPITPNPTPTPTVTPTQATTPTVTPAQTATSTQKTEKVTTPQTDLEKRLVNDGITPLPFEKRETPLSEGEIIAKLGGADRTKGSCSSVALAYAGQKGGCDVLDFRGGMSQTAFSSMSVIREITKLDGVVSETVRGGNDFTNAHKLLKSVVTGREYYFTAGKHAAIVRRTQDGIVQYLELQSGYREHTWYELTDYELRRRFGCQRSHSSYGMKFETTEVLIDVDSLKGNSGFERILQFINTLAGKEVKGVGGGEK